MFPSLKLQPPDDRSGIVAGRPKVLASIPRPRVILNLGARWLTKRWPPKHYAEIGRRAVARFGGGLVAVGAREDQPLVDAMARHIAPLRVLDLCGQTRLPQLAALSPQLKPI